MDRQAPLPLSLSIYIYIYIERERDTCAYIILLDDTIININNNMNNERQNGKNNENGRGNRAKERSRKLLPSAPLRRRTSGATHTSRRKLHVYGSGTFGALWLVTRLRSPRPPKGREPSRTDDTQSPYTNIVDIRGFDSNIISFLRGGILMSKGNFPESLSPAMLVGVMLVGGLDVVNC